MPRDELVGVPKVGVAAPVAQFAFPAAPFVPPARPVQPYVPWNARSAPSAHIVQHQYVAHRFEEMHRALTPDREAALKELEGLLLRKHSPGGNKGKIPLKELLRIYKKIEENLQAAELTININCANWFSQENSYNTYTQMYERAIQDDGQMILRNTELNPAPTRAAVDNQVSFPSDWSTAHTPARRGLAPGRQGVDRIKTQMDTGQLNQIGPGRYTAANKRFNPHTKQIFLGLNYGRRPHGSASNYGHSYFVLKDELKPSCFFYLGDTFLQSGQPTNASIQVPYYNLGALLGKTTGFADQLREQIFEACYEAKRLADPPLADAALYDLIEAHYFGELHFWVHVKHLIISRKDLKGCPADWTTVAENAKTFAEKHGFPIFQIE